MSNISDDQLKIIKNCVNKIAKKYRVIGVCLYGSKVAGYAQSKSDFDIIIVLEGYPHIIKYVYIKESGIEVSALVVDHKSLEKDAKAAFLGEFVVGRLLHIYEPITNPILFKQLEKTYKKRIILEEIFNIVKSTKVLSTEISFPLEFVMFSKIKHRSTLYPNAIYSYYKIYTGENAIHNTKFALDGYQQALREILTEYKELLVEKPSDNILQISDKSIQNGDRLSPLKMPKKLREFGSYLIHSYAGRHTFHYAIKEAKLKVRRHIGYRIELPKFISCPRQVYWKLPEGILIFDSRDWLDIIAKSAGFSRYILSKKKRLGDISSRTISYTLTNSDNENQKKVIVAKEIPKLKGVKWAALSVWTMPVKRFRVDPLFRLGTEYKALRYIRSLGLKTPRIESVVLDRKLLITEFIEGKTLEDIIKEFLKGNTLDGLSWIKMAGEQIAKIHADKSTLGNVKPKNLIIHKNILYFTDIEQFGFKSGDPVWDLVQFISWGLKGTNNTVLASQIIREFLKGYSKKMTIEYIKKLVKSKRYIESFYPILTLSVAQTIKKEINNFAS